MSEPKRVDHAKLVEALLAAQEEMPPVEPDKTNPHFKSKFVSLSNLLSKVRPVLNRHGLVLSQSPALEDGKFVLRTTIMHISGESISDSAPLSPAKDDPQGQGSAITYMRRYALGAALAIADQEDDGNAATSNGGGAADSVKRLNPERVEQIGAAIFALKLTYREVDLMLGACGADGIREDSSAGLRAALEALTDKQASAMESELEEKANAPDEAPAEDTPDGDSSGE